MGDRQDRTDPGREEKRRASRTEPPKAACRRPRACPLQRLHHRDDSAGPRLPPGSGPVPHCHPTEQGHEKVRPGGQGACPRTPTPGPALGKLARGLPPALGSGGAGWRGGASARPPWFLGVLCPPLGLPMCPFIPASTPPVVLARPSALPAPSPQPHVPGTPLLSRSPPFLHSPPSLRSVPAGRLPPAGPVL